LKQLKWALAGAPSAFGKHISHGPKACGPGTIRGWNNKRRRLSCISRPDNPGFGVWDGKIGCFHSRLSVHFAFGQGKIVNDIFSLTIIKLERAKGIEPSSPSTSLRPAICRQIAFSNAFS
jgi:hypothetical protein